MPSLASNRPKAASIRKRRYLAEIYDVNNYSPINSDANCCASCGYRPECESNLWTVTIAADGGYELMPLRCMPEHPSYDPSEWRHRLDKVPESEL